MRIQAGELLLLETAAVLFRRAAVPTSDSLHRSRQSGLELGVYHTQCKTIFTPLLRHRARTQVPRDLQRSLNDLFRPLPFRSHMVCQDPDDPKMFYFL